jgi:hypothetical protein
MMEGKTIIDLFRPMSKPFIAIAMFLGFLLLCVLCSLGLAVVIVELIEPLVPSPLYLIFLFIVLGSCNAYVLINYFASMIDEIIDM